MTQEMCAPADGRPGTPLTQCVVDVTGKLLIAGVCWTGLWLGGASDPFLGGFFMGIGTWVVEPITTYFRERRRKS